MKKMPMTVFVVGPQDGPLYVRFYLIWKQGSPNVATDDLLPPLNVNGLRRLAITLNAMADLIEAGEPWRDQEFLREQD